ncbi:MAG: hypothetical protein J0H96_11955 [Microbacterium ginsengisoli]|jgi:hypothetical protein|nr:hypothetical protein [Microbacterium ginsengisoli]
MSAISDYYTDGARPAGGFFGADRGGGRKHRGQDFSHSKTPGTGVPAILGGVVTGKLVPASWHGFGFQITTRVTLDGVDYFVSYAHGPAAQALPVGATFSEGQIISAEGTTGATVGSCTHIEVQRVGGGFIDPWPFIQRALAVVAAPAQPAVVAPGVPAPAFPLPAGSFFGPEGGKSNSVSGYHSHRDDLKRWQQRMQDRGWDITVDGLYGPAGAKTPQGQTAKVALAFQTEKGLTRDSLIGPETWAAAWTAPITR